jgi:hypothetical protein
LSSAWELAANICSSRNCVMNCTTRRKFALMLGCNAHAITACTNLIAFICTVAATSISLAQIGQPEWGANRASDGLALIDGSQSRAAAEAPIEPPRFAISVVLNHALLVDSKTGRTWFLVFDESDRPSHWAPLARKKRRCRIAMDGQLNRRPNVRLKRSRPSDLESFDPFRAETARPQPRSQEEQGGKPPTEDARPRDGK